MNMAKKDETEGQCPACCVSYTKKNCRDSRILQEVVAEINLERKMKSQKSKTELSEEMKQLGSVRVIQRN